MVMETDIARPETGGCRFDEKPMLADAARCVI
jgi:hypothetical protein